MVLLVRAAVSLCAHTSHASRPDRVTELLFALTLRGSSGGHCVELKGAPESREARYALWALRAPSASGLSHT
jgi:hypothetical protein